MAPLMEKYGDEKKPLELLLVGHNPSNDSWSSGHYYSNPTNLMWKLLPESGLIPLEWGPCCDDRIVSELLIGFTDLGRTPGNISSNYSRKEMLEWRDDFYKRIKKHAERVNGSPKRIAFTGKRQFSQLFEPPKKTIEYGCQEISPANFPVDCEIWVLPSSSGRSVIGWDERLKPYTDLCNSMQNAFTANNIE